MITALRSGLAVLILVAAAGVSHAQDGKKIRVLIIDGQNNHAWKQTTPVLKKALEDCGFAVEVATSPSQLQKPKAPKEKTEENLAKFEELKRKYAEYLGEMEKFQPDLSKCDVIVSNYNGDQWGKKLSQDFDDGLKEGKFGVVIVHAANNSFGGWNEYRRIVGMGWYGAGTGDRLLLDDKGDRVIIPKGKGDGPGHRYTGKFSVIVRDAKHPITKGMPMEWLHNNDELYDNMRGPIENVQLLATAYSKGTKAHEPMIWTVSYGKGRVFHTPMGHDVNAMLCVGFQATLQRGTEWAATGAVTLPLPDNFPTADKVSVVPKAK
jgi:type 1 glutamine amidotransferase